MQWKLEELFAYKYRRYFQIFAPLSRNCPNFLWPLIQKTFGRFWNPYQLRKNIITTSLKIATNPNTEETVWNAWLDSHSHFIRDFSRYHLMNKMNINKYVHIIDIDLVRYMQINGGLLLTYHTHHQNTLCSILGIMGCKLYAVADAPEHSPMFPYIGLWMKQINKESSKHFHGGRYLFNNDLRCLQGSVKDAFSEKALVVCLADFPSPKRNNHINNLSFNFFSKQITPPTGVIRLAIRYKVPIYIAICTPCDQKLVVQLQDLGRPKSLEDTLKKYIKFLEDACRKNPACWQGWDGVI